MKKWNILNDSDITVSQADYKELIQVLLTNRGLQTNKAIEEFLHPSLITVTPELVGIDQKQITKTLKRIKQAIEKQEEIIVYGDYDVDGITGCAILWETLHALGAKVMPYIPHRIDEGYGLSVKGITNVRTEYPNIAIIVTVDNGIVANDAVDFANEQGIDVIITDHHVSAGGEESKSPNAYSIVHTTQLCGAGVAYLLSKELQVFFNHILEDTFLELATLGTVADLVPLTGANRTIVSHGLKALRKTKRKGLLALFSEAGSDPESIEVYEIGHVIGPRLNATGRMESAMDSLRLLCTKDTKRAEYLAALLGKTNKERQQVMFDATSHASLTVKERKELKKLLVVSHDEYPEGVIGLVAGRLVEEYYRPSIVIAKGEKTSKGSVRSIQGFNIIEFLRQLSDYFVNVGGHPMAAGFTVETNKIEALTEALEVLAEEAVHDEHLVRSLRIDMELLLADVTRGLYTALLQLSPFGMGNPEPTFVSKNVELKDIRLLGSEGKHVRLLLQQDFGQIHEAVAFGMGELYQSLAVGDLIDVVYTVDENTWKGNTKLQLKIKDIRKRN